ncbi:MAG: hypothetical protein KDA61_13475 [Planctomycetales bacterium]|nr:hypothetical protein [Planctomycetales bacterium]
MDEPHPLTESHETTTVSRREAMLGLGSIAALSLLLAGSIGYRVVEASRRRETRATASQRVDAAASVARNEAPPAMASSSADVEDPSSGLSAQAEARPATSQPRLLRDERIQGAEHQAPEWERPVFVAPSRR